jgi:hypothetical protein
MSGFRTSMRRGRTPSAPAFVADATAQVALVSRSNQIEIITAPRSRRFDDLRILKRGGEASIRHHVESNGVPCPLSGGAPTVPAANLCVKLPASVAGIR